MIYKEEGKKDMEDLLKLFSNFMHTKLVTSIIIILISILLYKVVMHFLTKGEKNDKLNLFTSKKSRTYLKLTRNLIRYVFIAITALILLQVNGVDVSSLLAGVGIAGVVIGLAIQDWLKDIIRGSSILTDNYFAVGDVVKYNEMEGKVLAIGLKTTKIQDLKTGNILSMANRNIEAIEVVSNLVYVNVPMPYEVPVERAEEVIDGIVAAIMDNNHVTGCRYISVNELEDSYIAYGIEIQCNQVYKRQVKRDALRSILVEMAKHEIEVPYTQVDIHEK